MEHMMPRELVVSYFDFWHLDLLLHCEVLTQVSLTFQNVWHTNMPQDLMSG